MSVPMRHAFKQGPVVRQLLRAGFKSALGSGTKEPLKTPGPSITDTIPPRSPDLVRDYIEHMGGDPAWYEGVVPPHLFPQWGMAYFPRLLDDAPYKLSKVLNGGASITVNRPLPADEPLKIEACLEDIQEKGKVAILRQRIVTGTESAPEAVIGYLNGIVVIGKSGDGEKKEKKEKPTVPEDAREIGRWKAGPNAGWDFAKLTGDFNPIHWIRPLAKMSGFKNTILHGFATMAYSIETMNRHLFDGDPTQLEEIEVRFERPLVLPGEAGVYIKETEGEVFAGKSPGDNAYMTGNYKRRKEASHE